MEQTTPMLLIDSRDPFGREDGGFARALALELARARTPVALLLVQDAVLGARRGVPSRALAALAAAGAEVLADRFALHERGIDPAQLATGVAPAALDIVIDRLAAGWRVLWH